MSTGGEVGFLWGTENQFGKGGLSQKVHTGQKCVAYLGSGGDFENRKVGAKRTDGRSVFRRLMKFLSINLYLLKQHGIVRKLGCHPTSLTLQLLPPVWWSLGLRYHLAQWKHCFQNGFLLYISQLTF